VVVGGSVIVPAGYPGVSAMLRKLGFEILPVAMSEFRKMDGGVSCLSLRW
jgi:dimethylargininase